MAKNGMMINKSPNLLSAFINRNKTLLKNSAKSKGYKTSKNVNCGNKYSWIV